MSSEIDAREQNPCFESEFESGAKDIKKLSSKQTKFTANLMHYCLPKHQVPKNCNRQTKNGKNDTYVYNYSLGELMKIHKPKTQGVEVLVT